MTSLKDALRRLNASDSTCREITALYKHADILTKTGSGRIWSYGQNAMAAVCAFTALGNNEISKDQARAAACIDAKTFEAALSAARRILFAPSSYKSKEGSTTYQTLLKQYDVMREDASVIMMEVQHCLQGKNVETTSAAMQGSIFYWVCTNILQVSLPGEEHMRKSINVTLKDWSSGRRTIERYCTSMKSGLIQNAVTATSRNSRSRKTSTQTAIDSSIKPSTPKGHVLQAPSIVDSGALNPGAMKRKASSDTFQEAESPLKRLRGAQSVYTPSKLRRDSTTHTPIFTRSNASNKVMFSMACRLGKQIQTEDDSDEDSIGEAIVVQLRKPSPYDAFFAEGPLATPAQAPGNVEEPFETPSTVAEAKRTPVTSTGTFKTSSPGSPLKSRSRDAPVTPTVTKRLFPVIEAEEPSRWRRRNLRAPFLDPDNYGWRLTAASAKRFALARNWEKNMIKKYGDPWESL
ncbi:hypothetical protein BU17DRAFT_92878 [Hysterangium stoloniferum]|nr:hypothetical protein BU17DRAFT_92878 [Hysterangium stoloniferum]